MFLLQEIQQKQIKSEISRRQEIGSSRIEKKMKSKATIFLKIDKIVIMQGRLFWKTIATDLKDIKRIIKKYLENIMTISWKTWWKEKIFERHSLSKITEEERKSEELCIKETELRIVNLQVHRCMYARSWP